MTTDLDIKPLREVDGERRLAKIAPGAMVLYNERPFVVRRVVNLDQIECVEIDTEEPTILQRKSLTLIFQSGTSGSSDLAAISPEQWREAQKRYAAIEPLLHQEGSAAFEKRAAEIKKSKASLYRWHGLFRATGNLVSLIPKPRGWRAGSSRLDPLVLMLVDKMVADLYLTPRRLRVAHVVREVQSACVKQNLPPPAYNAVARRIRVIPEEKRLRARGMREEAERKFRAVPGKFPEAEFPLAVVQIDHTQADIILVDSVERKPIGRPWLTIALDIYSRVMVGYHVSLEAPSFATDGLCVALSILQKETLLQELGINHEWPVFGVPRKIHTDNGADFRSDDFNKACEAYGISLEFRPPGRPQFGGHIERNFRSLNTLIHTLPGTTFSSPRDRGKYKSEKNARLTIEEFEKIVVEHICGVYHNSLHTSIDSTPIRRWTNGILGKNGVGLPQVPNDELRLRLDFMPSFKRTIQTDGVSFMNFRYYSETLRDWISASDPNRPKEKRKFIFRYDPRDVRLVWFYDPASKRYYEVPNANRNLPAISFWEAKKLRAVLRAEGKQSVNEHAVIRARENIEANAAEAGRKSKSLRRSEEKRRRNAKTSMSGAAIATATKQAVPIAHQSIAVDGFVDDVEDLEQVW